MFKDLLIKIYQNKNILMFVSVMIYILALFAVLSGHTVCFSLILTLLFIFAVFKNIFPIKIIFIWCLIFYFGLLNTSLRIKYSDDLLNLAPTNAIIYGKIISIPEKREDNKIKFIFNVNKIEYEGMTKTFNKKEKVFVTINTDEKLNIYDSYKINGRLSSPFKSGNPSQFDYGNYLKNFSVYTVFYGHNFYSMKDLNIPCYEKLPLEKSNIEKFLQKINNQREKVLRVHANYIKSPNLEILGGIVFGDDAISPPENIRQSFINSGLLHILAASGMNVAFIYSFFFFFLNFYRVPYRINIVICILAVLTYVLMTGLGASVLRAALMLTFVLVGKLIDRDTHSISLLSFVALLMLIYNPMYINDVGFQLSFVVTFGLLLMTPYLIQNKNRILNWIIGTISIPIIAQLWVIPIQIFYFNNVSIYSVFANIMSVPLLSVISFGGFISTLLSVILFPFAHFICRWFDIILNPLITVLVKISDFWGCLPNASIQTTHPNIFQILIYYGILINLTIFMNKELREKYSKILKISTLSFIILLLVSTISIPNKKLEITAFDVGNADAFMIKTPQNEYFMIDTARSGYNGGKSQAEIIILKYFTDIGIKKINSVIITHFDNDHCGGAKDLIEKLAHKNGKNKGVEKIYVNSINHPSNSAKEIIKAAKENNTQIIEAKNKQTVYENNDGLKITNYISEEAIGIGDNEASIVTLLTYKDFSMLFMGDAGIETFEKLKSNLPQNITVLKVGHHGAFGVINKNMFKYLNPEYSIISTGQNKFGHPAIYTMEVLKKSKILRTDFHNSIRLATDGNKLQIYYYEPKRKKYIMY